MSNRSLRLITLAALLLVVGLALNEASELWLEPRLEAASAGVVRPVREPAGAASSLDILRDAETREAIARTRGVALPSHAESPLRFIVTKSRYRLDLVGADGLSLKTYPVALGGSPVGAKEREGDQRTPEGDYLLLPHHASPAFGPCFYVGYPNAADAERGLASGLIDARQARGIRASLEKGRKPAHATQLGGLILLHSLRGEPRQSLTRTNWTLGCIAMEKPDLEELLRSFAPSDRPRMEIRP